MVWVQICFFAALRLRSALDEHCGAAGSAGSDGFRALHKAPADLTADWFRPKCGRSFPSQPLQLSMAASCLLITDDIIITFIFTLQSQSVQQI